jgi:hypothetical protein
VIGPQSRSRTQLPTPWPTRSTSPGVKGYVVSFEFDGTTKEESAIEALVTADGEELEFAQAHTRSGTLEVRTKIE